jgi:aconitate hydratase 2/2-methylisocitrate dehydratase
MRPSFAAMAATSADDKYCMTNIGHFRAVAQLLKDQSALPTELWVVPPTRMDEAQLKKEGVYQTFESLTQHTETPGCSLCMGNQARVH